MRRPLLVLPLLAALVTSAAGAAHGQVRRSARADTLRVGAKPPAEPVVAKDQPSYSAPRRTDRKRAKGASALAGFVRDSLGRPIPYAEVALDEYDAATITDDSGHFRLERVPVGVVRFTAHRLDYLPVSFEIDMPAQLTVHVDIRLRGGVAALREVASADSAAPSARLATSGYFQRAALRQGYFFSPSDVELMNGYTHVAYLLQKVPGFTVEERANGRVSIKGRGCLRYYVDGADLPALPDSLSPVQVLAIEAYPVFVMTPLRFRGNDRRECGVVAVWTKLPKPYGKR